MKPEEFNGKAGNVSMSSKGPYFVFTPKSLPQSIIYNDELVALLSSANRAIGNLNGLLQQLPNPYLISRPYMKKEAVVSSRIEGTYSSLSDVVVKEATGQKDEPDKNKDLQEVMNYNTALENAIKAVNEQQNITFDCIISMHSTLLTNTRGYDKDPGKLRVVQNWLGENQQTPLIEARFVPPEPEAVKPLLINLLDYLAANDGIDPLVKIGIAHYQFETIHPFRDGNGRVGRLILLLYLIKNKVISHPALSPSVYLERNRGDYYDALLNVSKKGEYEKWLGFFLKGIIVQSEDAIARINRLAEYRNKCRRQLKEFRASKTAYDVLELLFDNPAIYVPQASAKLGVSYPPVNNAVKLMVEGGILTEVTGWGRNRVFVAGEILKIVGE